MKLARILIAASSGTNGHVRLAGPELERVAVRRDGPRSRCRSCTSRRIATSLIFGHVAQDAGSSVRTAAAIILRTAFLAPAMRTSPESGAPPVITNFCMER